MKEDLQELPADVKALLAVERAPLPMPRDVHERLAKRLATVSLGVAALSTLVTFGGRLARFFSGRAGLALVSFSVGGGTGVAVHEAVVRHREARRHVPISAPAPAPIPAPPLPRPPPEIAVPAAPRLRERAAPSAPSTLAAERTLLEIARTALTRGDAAGALAAVTRHAAQYPRGALGEERESLRVQALLAAGRRLEAREALRQLEAKYPQSLGLSALRAQVDGSP